MREEEVRNYELECATFFGYGYLDGSLYLKDNKAVDCAGQLVFPFDKITCLNMEYERDNVGQIFFPFNFKN